ILDSKGARELYPPPYYNLPGFLRLHLQALFVDGRSFARVRWSSDRDLEGGEAGPRTSSSPRTRRPGIRGEPAQDKVEGFVPLGWEGVKVKGPREAPACYDVDPTEAHRWVPRYVRSTVPRYRLRADQMVAFYWPAGLAGFGPPPVQSVIKEYWDTERSLAG